VTRLHAQTANCADFDVFLNGDDTAPSFRVLLPEWVRGEGVEHTGAFHVIPGEWRGDEFGLSGQFTVGGQLEIGVRVNTEPSAFGVTLTVRNVGESAISHVWANICAGVTHLPGEPGWSNARFIPGVPLDRTEQGRYWYDVLTPRRLVAFTRRGWIPMHPTPDAPDSTKVPLYSFTPSQVPEASACAVESADGGLWFYQWWDAPCLWCAPFPGNACMHLEPFVAERLVAGETASIRGRIGMHEGDRASLEGMLRRLGGK